MKAKKNRNSIFITFEGIEGCGKSTQAELLAGRLKKAGYRVKLTREPGGTNLGEKVRHILLHSKDLKIFPLTELFLYLASRSQHVEEVIRRHLRKNFIVISDRFNDSSIAYQGYGRRLGYKIVEILNKFATGGIKPDLTIILDCPTKVGLKRRFNRRGIPDRLEREKLAFHERVRRGYLALAQKEKKRMVIVNANAPKKEIAKKISRTVSDKFGLRGL